MHLTYPNGDEHTSSDRPLPQSDLTPEMIEAGAEILFAEDALNGIMDMGYGRELTRKILTAALDIFSRPV